jgi:tetratricopeptide (TPR) repeat protein
MGTNNLIAARYYFWLPNRVKRKDIVDWEHTKMHIEPETGFSRVARLVLQSDRLGTVPLLFQVGGRILVHETLRATLEAEGIRGLAFAPLDMAYSPYDALRILAMQRQLQEHPDDWALWYELSRGLTASGKYDEALDALEHVLALNPTYAEAWHQRGRTLHQMGRLQEALEALQQAITLDPLNWAWRERCQILQEQGRNEEALACAEHLVVIKDKAYFS